MANSKNLLIITVSPFPYSTASANILRLLSLGLKNEGYTVNLLIQRGQSVETYCNIGPKEGEIDGIGFQYCGYPNKQKSIIKKGIDVIKGIIYPFYFIIKNRKKIDYILTYNNYFHEDILNIVACKLFGIKIIHYDVDWYNKESVVRSVLNLPKWYSYLLKKYYMSKLYDGIIVISKYLEDFYIKRAIQREKLLRLPNLVNLKDYKNNTNLKKDNDNIRIGYSGGAPLANGVDDLIKAFKLINGLYPEAELLIVGDVIGEASHIPLLKKIAKENGVEDKVIFTGYVNGNKVPDYLLSCDILVLARKNSIFAQAGFPTKLGEYLISKRPVVMTNVGDISDYFVNKRELMICEPDTPESIAESILYLIKNPEKRKQISENGYNWANENLNYIKATKRVSEFISQEK